MTITLKCIIGEPKDELACGTSRMGALRQSKSTSLENLGSSNSTENIVIKPLPVFQLSVLSEQQANGATDVWNRQSQLISASISAPQNREFDHVISDPQYKYPLNPRLTRRSMQTICIRLINYIITCKMKGVVNNGQDMIGFSSDRNSVSMKL